MGMERLQNTLIIPNFELVGVKYKRLFLNIGFLKSFGSVSWLRRRSYPSRG